MNANEDFCRATDMMGEIIPDSDIFSDSSVDVQPVEVDKETVNYQARGDVVPTLHDEAKYTVTQRLLSPCHNIVMPLTVGQFVQEANAKQEHAVTEDTQKKTQTLFNMPDLERLRISYSEEEAQRLLKYAPTLADRRSVCVLVN